MTESKYGPCKTCGATHQTFLVPVWEDITKAEQGDKPDYFGCKECNTMTKL